ncbi:MAG TPA: anti-sigma factor [Candidatus Binatia bacterium]|nr:anti-sigma factor [Candidatus Binatia bacterium]
MDCKNAQTLLGGYLDRELDVVRTLEIEDHLHGCAVCSQSYKDHQVLSEGLRTGSVYFKAPADLQKRIQRSVRQAAKAESAPRWLSWSWVRIAAPMAAAALVLLTLVPFLRGPSTEEILAREVVSSHVRSLMANHLADVSSSDQHTVKPWFNGKVDFSPPVVDLASQGFQLVGGRLDYLDNRPVAALIYQRDKHLINVFIWPSSESSDSGIRADTRQGYHVFHWTRSGMTYWVVSDLEGNQLQEFIRLLQNQAPTKQ